MITFVIVIHSIVCVLLVLVILMQSGRGGGLTEQFASAENVFGSKTNAVMVRITSVLTCIFVVTSCSLAYLHAKKEESLFKNRMKIEIPINKDAETKMPDVSQNKPASVNELPASVQETVSTVAQEAVNTTQDQLPETVPVTESE